MKRTSLQRAFTLIEMLVSLAITMMMMGAAVTLFQNISESVSGSRSIIEMSDRLRSVRNRLQADLVGATSSMRPPARPENDEGYFEYREGAATDYSFYAGGAPDMFGDTDDTLMFTTRSRGEPFVGKLGNTMITSPVAEVIYYLAQQGTEYVVDSTTTPPLQLYTLYRRVLLVYPGNTPFGPVPSVYDLNDLSVRFQKLPAGPNYATVANSLGDLTKRENRFAHFGSSLFQFPFDVAVPSPTLPNGSNLPNPANNNVYLSPLRGARLGDDVLLTNVLAFDVQVFDPGAPVYLNSTSSMAIEQRDPAYPALIGTATPVAYGAYVDLGYKPTGYTPPSGNPLPQFNGRPHIQSGFYTMPYSLFDTWSLHYEVDGILQLSRCSTAAVGGTALADAGFNGLDDFALGVQNGIVDDVAERDTMPPYSAAPLGIRVTIRVYDPNSQQIRQVEVVQDFLPE